MDSGRCSPALNMALDEALLEAAPQTGRPVLRFYGWTEPAASFGYFQSFCVVEKSTLLRPLIRRPTGGGIVPHDADWTYSVVIPPGDGWYQLSARESYQRIHEWICGAFSEVGIQVSLAEDARKPRPGECFAGHELHDVVWQGRKIAGAAQRRTRAGLLIQGSVQPPPLKLDRITWQQAMAATLPDRWNSQTPDPKLEARAATLAVEKYATEAYTRRR